MEKKTYLKPSMQAVELRRHQPLLQVSNPKGEDSETGEDAYIPGMREDMNQMA